MSLWYTQDQVNQLQAAGAEEFTIEVPNLFLPGPFTEFPFVRPAIDPRSWQLTVKTVDGRTGVFPFEKAPKGDKEPHMWALNQAIDFAKSTREENKMSFEDEMQALRSTPTKVRDLTEEVVQLDQQIEELDYKWTPEKGLEANPRIYLSKHISRLTDRQIMDLATFFTAELRKQREDLVAKVRSLVEDGL